MSKEYFKSKLTHMPGTALSPEVLLHQILDKAPGIKSVVIITQWEDGTFESDWSSMKVSDLCMASRILNHDVDLVLTESHPDVEFTKKK